MEDPWKRPVFVPAIYYRDPKTMLGWLAQAFGFETVMVITDPGGVVVHAEMRLGDGLIMVGGEWADWTKSPASADGVNTQTTHVYPREDIDAHCRRARAAGAVIAMEPEDQFYGDRVYRALDPEGHSWTFSQSVKLVTREAAEQASGLKIEGWPDMPV